MGLHAGLATDPGIIDSIVNGAELGNGSRHHMLDVRLGRNVDFDGDHLDVGVEGTQSVCHSWQPLRVDISEHELGASFFHEGLSRGSADSGGGAGDEGDSGLLTIAMRRVVETYPIMLLVCRDYDPLTCEMSRKILAGLAVFPRI